MLGFCFVRDVLEAHFQKRHAIKANRAKERGLQAGFACLMIRASENVAKIKASGIIKDNVVALRVYEPLELKLTQEMRTRERKQLRNGIITNHLS
jgi:hypothetical protein